MKAVLFCAAFAACCLLLAGCGGTADLSDSEYVGTWVARTMDVFGDEESTTDIEEVVEGGLSITLSGDGTLVADLGDGEPLSASWKETGDGFKTKGDINLTFTAEEGGVSANLLGAHIHFVKE